MSAAAGTGGHTRRAFLGGAGMSVAAAVALTLAPGARALALPNHSGGAGGAAGASEGDWHVDDICGHMPRYAHPIPYMHDTSPPDIAALAAAGGSPVRRLEKCRRRPCGRRRKGEPWSVVFRLRSLRPCSVCPRPARWLTGARAADAPADVQLRVATLAANVQLAEDLSHIEKLQRAYGYYVDKGLWEDLSELFTENAVANYPAGVFVGRQSIREHLYMNVGGHQIGDIGLGNGRLYDHMNIQPVVHIDAGGLTAHGRWRAFAMFGSPGGGATWAEGVYEMQYTKEHGVWKISKLDYYSGFGAPYKTGWAAPPAAAAGSAAPAASAARSTRGAAAPPAGASGRYRAQHGLRRFSQGLHRAVSLRQSGDHAIIGCLGAARCGEPGGRGGGHSRRPRYPRGWPI